MKKFLEKVKGLMEKLMPMYGWVILIIMIIWDVIVFQGTRLFNTGWHHYSMETKWDDMIPYIKEWIWIYLPLAYAQWILGFIPCFLYLPSDDDVPCGCSGNRLP